MAKDKKKLENLSKKDLQRREEARTVEVKKLQEEKKQADTKQEKKEIQKQIEKKQERIAEIKSVATKKEPAKLPTVEDKLQKLYSSDRFLGLSPEQQQLVRTTVTNFNIDPTTLQLSKKEKRLAYKDALNSAVKQFKGDKTKLAMDHEEALNADIRGLEDSINYQKALLQTDDAYTADQRKQTIRQLQDALNEATAQYSVEAERKNKFLQKSLEDIQYNLDTEVGRANEDKVIELRQLQRAYNTKLRDTQNNMAMRGLAFSGIRAQAEDELDAEYGDYMTTAELNASRRISDAQHMYDVSKRDVTTQTEQDLQDLITKYTGVQKEAIQGAEAGLGTGAAQELVGDQYNIGGQSARGYLVGDIGGTISQQEQQNRATRQNAINQQFGTFEQLYGANELNQRFGQVPGYNPIGLQGASATKYQRDLEKLRQDKVLGVKEGTRLNKSKYLLGKL